MVVYRDWLSSSQIVATYLDYKTLAPTERLQSAYITHIPVTKTAYQISIENLLTCSTKPLFCPSYMLLLRLAMTQSAMTQSATSKACCTDAMLQSPASSGLAHESLAHEA